MIRPGSIKLGGRDMPLAFLGAGAHPAADDLFHALCHWAEDTTTLDRDDPPASRVAVGLIRVLRDNPALGLWLAESFASQPQQGEFNGTEVVKASA